MTSLLDLPQEIQLNVIRYLESRDLKRLRVCKHLDSLIIPELFQQLTLYPHIDFLLRAANALEAFRNLSGHIRKITYDCHWTAPIIHIYDFLERTRFSEAAVTDILRAEKSYNNDILREGDDITEFVLLQRIITSIPRLACFEYVGEDGPKVSSDVQRKLPRFYDDLWLFAESEYYQNPPLNSKGTFAEFVRSKGFASSSSHAKNSLFALGSIASSFRFELKCCNLACLVGHERAEPYDKSAVLVKPVLHKIRELCHKTFYHHNSTIPRIWNDANLGFILQNMDSLETLHLDFGPLDDNQSLRDEYPRPLFSSLEPNIFGSPETRIMGTNLLRNLTLEDLRCDEDIWYKLLSEVSHTLRSLELNRLILLRSEGTQIQPCLVRMLKFLQSQFQLEKVSLCGQFSNNGLQDWLIVPHGFCNEGFMPRNKVSKKTAFTAPVNSKSLEQQVCNFILNGGTCPLESEAIPDGCKDLPTHLYHPKAQDAGDYSWRLRGRGCRLYDPWEQHVLYSSINGGERFSPANGSEESHQIWPPQEIWFPQHSGNPQSLSLPWQDVRNMDDSDFMDDLDQLEAYLDRLRRYDNGLEAEYYADIIEQGQMQARAYQRER